METEKNNKKHHFEDALDKTGFGLYNYTITLIAGLTNISLVSMAFSATVIVPASACDLGTTTGQQGVMVAAPYVGFLFGNILWGYLADTRGRRKMILVSLISSAIMNVITSFSINWIMLMVFQFITLFLASGLNGISVTIASECTPIKRRNMVVLLVTSLYLMGQGIMSVLGIPILPYTYSHYIPGLGINWTSWRTLLMIYSVPSILTALCLSAMEESPKYVLGKGDEEGALKILKTIHRWNKGSSKQLEVSGLLLENDNSGSKMSAKGQLAPLFKFPLLRFTLIMSAVYVLFQTAGVFLQWLPTISNLFFQNLNVEGSTGLNLCGMISGGLDAPPDENAVPCAIDENALWIVLIVCVMQSGLNATFSVVVQFAGRRNTAVVATAVFGLCGIMVNLVPNAIGSAVFFVGFLMSVVCMGMYSAITCAVFPTQVRVVAFAIVVTGGQITSFALIQIVNYLLVNSCKLAFYLFASLFTLSAGVLMLLPDDRLLANQKTEDSIKNELVT